MAGSHVLAHARVAEMGDMLNLDILHNIMSFSDRSSTSRLMRTCRTLNHEGAKYLVRQTPCLWSEDGVVSFTQYALARADGDEMAHRLHWLRGLQLKSPWYLDSCKKFARAMMSCLSHLVIHAPNFVELDLQSCEVLFSVDDGFAQVVGAAVRLQKLTLNNANLCALKMLRHSSLRLSSARISVVYEAVEPSFSDHPLLALHNSKDTLRTLTLENIAFDPDRSMPRYSNLAHFEFSSLFVPPIHHLVQIFPNLQTLKVGTFPGYNHLNDTEAEAERQTNIRAQAQHGTFRALQAYTGSTLALYLFALACHIPSLSLCDEDRHSCWDMYMLQTVCARARPTHLRLHTSFLEDWPYDAEDFVQLWASEGLQGTHTLTLHLDITWHAGDVDLGPVLVSVNAH